MAETLKQNQFKVQAIKTVTPERQKIAYYTINDPHDKRSWSGCTYFMGRSLEKYVGDVDFLGPVKIPWILDKFFRGTQKISRLLFRKEYIPKYSLLKNMYAAAVLKNRMKGKTYDFVFAPAAASELAYLKTSTPIVYLGDATYKLYSETYTRDFQNQHFVSRLEGNHLEQKALNKSDLVLFSSQWAADSAHRDYGISKDRIEVIQMGANIPGAPDRSLIYAKKNSTQLVLLFLAVEWDRKGGPVAFDTLVALVNSGVDVRLIICGCVPPASFRHPAMEVIPFLNKNLATDLQIFEAILQKTHFLFLPTRADCTPMVNCEANAFGIPVITTDVGGIRDAVVDGVNGFCLPLEATGNDYARIITETFSNKELYSWLIDSSRDRFEQVLNWDKFAETLISVLQKHKLRH